MKEDNLYLEHILQCILNIEKWMLEGKQVFLDEHDSKTRDAILRNLQIMAESTQRLSDKVKNDLSDINWRSIAGFRNIIVHEYMGLDMSLIWTTMEYELPKLKKSLTNYLVKK